MPQNKIRIDPRLPVVWESIDTLRIGFDTALVRIDNPSAAAQRLLHRLRRGILTNTLITVASESGCTPAERDRIQYLCSPVLITETNDDPPADPPSCERSITTNTHLHSPTDVAVLGQVRARAQVISILRCRGFRIHAARTLEEIYTAERAPHAIILLERFWALPQTLHRLMLLAIPHIILRFSDQTVSIGPIIVPGQTPCGVCMQITDSQQDPALPILASQLLRAVPATEHPHIVDFAAMITCMLFCATLLVQHPEGSAKLVYEVQQRKIAPAPRVVTYTQQPDCGCQVSEEPEPRTQDSDL